MLLSDAPGANRQADRAHLHALSCPVGIVDRHTQSLPSGSDSASAEVWAIEQTRSALARRLKPEIKRSFRPRFTGAIRMIEPFQEFPPCSSKLSLPVRCNSQTAW